jgi:hypothetical protein
MQINKYIISIFSKILPKPIPKLIKTRWDINCSEAQINKKIDFSNEDHCGPCGSSSLPLPKETMTQNHIRALEKWSKNI